MEKALLFDTFCKVYIAADVVNPIDMATFEVCSDLLDMVNDISTLYSTEQRLTPPTPTPASPAAMHDLAGDSSRPVEEVVADLFPAQKCVFPYIADEPNNHQTLVRLGDGQCSLYYRRLNARLALVCLIPTNNLVRKRRRAIVMHNVTCAARSLRYLSHTMA